MAAASLRLASGGIALLSSEEEEEEEEEEEPAVSSATPAQRHFPAEKSVYTQAMDAALRAAHAAVAGSGAPLFDDAERLLLERMLKLDATPRMLLARLVFISGPWHRWKADVLKYTVSPQEALDAVHALEAAGALLVFSAAAARRDTLELLPCLVLDELRPIRAAVKQAASAAAKEAGGKKAKLRELMEDEKGDKKPSMLACIVGLAGSYPSIELEALVAGVMTGGGGGGPCVRIAPAAEGVLLRALRLAERSTAPAAHRPAPPTRLMVATLLNKPKRKSSVVVTPELLASSTPLFASRAHFHLTEAAIELEAAVRYANCAGAEGRERPGADAWAEKQRAEARKMYASCRVEAAMATLRASLLLPPKEGSSHEEVPSTLPDDPRACFDVACALALAAVPLFFAYYDTAFAAYVQSKRPAFARRYDAGDLLGRALFVHVRLLERTAEAHRVASPPDVPGAIALYQDAAKLLEAVIRVPLLQQQTADEAAEAAGGPGAAMSDAVAFSGDDSGGADSLSGGVLATCYVRLLRDLKALSRLGDEEAAPKVQLVLEEAKRELPPGSASLWNALASAGESWRAPLPERTLEQASSGRVGVVGSRLLFNTDAGEQVLVENLAGDLLRQKANGGWSYAHDEGRCLRELFGLLLHEQIFDASVRDVFFAPCMGAPLDLHSPHFYAARQPSLDKRLAEIADAPPSRLARLIRAAYDAHYGKASAFVRWGEARVDHMLHLQKIGVCFGGRALAGILLHMARTGVFAGMPDLTIIKAARPNVASSTEAGTASSSSSSTPIDIGHWEVEECAVGSVAEADAGGSSSAVGGGESLVDIPLVQMAKGDAEAVATLQQLREGEDPLGGGGAAAAPRVALELKAVSNRFGVGGRSMEVHLLEDGGGCVGFVSNEDYRRVRPGAATGTFSAGVGEWRIEARPAAAYTIVVGDDWELSAELVEVKSEKDSLWAEQRMWLRALLDSEWLRTCHYENPYLFDESGAPTVGISIFKVTGKGKAKAKGGSGKGGRGGSGGRGRGGKRVVENEGAGPPAKQAKPKKKGADEPVVAPERPLVGSGSCDAPIELDSDSDFE